MLSTRILTAACLVAGFGVTSTALAGQPSVCELTAQTMFRACLSDVKDDFLTLDANCLNIGDEEEQSECFEESSEDSADEKAYCRDVKAARLDACDLLAEDLYDPDPLLDEGITFVHPDDVDEDSVNPYVSVIAGHTYVLNVTGGDDEEMVIVHVTDETREILGVECRVVVDVVVEESEEFDEEDGWEWEYEAIEVTDDWFAQDENGDVYYCGEVARNFEDGVLRDLDGSFEAGIEYAKAGVIIRADPVAGEVHRQEYSLGEAEDIIQYMGMGAPTEEEGGDNAAFPCDPECLVTFDFAPVEPESTEYKYYLEGVGFVLAVGLEDGEITGEREELVCVGDSLDVLGEDECGIEDADELLEELCELSPDAFCADDD